VRNRMKLSAAALAGAGALALAAIACSGPEAEKSEAPMAAATAAPTTPVTPAVKTRTVTPPAEAPHWAYEGEAGPGSWGKLSADFAACSAGRNQSPIDIGATTSAALPDLRTAFRAAELKIAHHEHFGDAINNGHTIQVNYPQGDTLIVGDESFELAQYHFHGPSEHTVAGEHSPMEMHLVHKSSAGKLAVIGVLIEQGAHNAAFEPIWSNLPKTKGVESHFEHVKVNVDDLLPQARTTYRYDGSLTTPPCSEGVKWFVMTTPVELSAAQIAAFTAIIEANNRPVQPLNGRVVITDRVEQVRR